MVSSISSTKKKVFIVGAGPSGLVALKEILEAGHDPLCVDAKKQIGGIFSVSYDELYTTTSNMFMAFSDFPPKEGLKYWTKEEYLQYLEDYVDHFGLRKYIKLDTAVKHCELDKDTSRWKIRTTDWVSTPGEMRRGSIIMSSETPEQFEDLDGKRQNAVPTLTYDADYLIVASGTNQVPRIPYLHNCNAEIIHTADFTNAKSICEGKKVLVIGNGECASDVAAQATDVAEKVTLFSRKDFSLGPRFISTFLKDGGYDERQMLVDQDKHDLGPYDMLEGITNNRVFSRLPTAIFSLALDAMLTDVTNLHGEDSAAGILAKIDKKNFRKDFYALDTSARTKSGGVLAHAVACKGLDIIVSSEVQFIEDGDIARFKNVSFMGKGENKVDQLDLEVDTVILCTGFELNFDWIDVGKDPVEANPRKWFKHCFPPELGNQIAFLGYARPAQGGIPQCSELLARYVALLLNSERTLPEDYVIQAISEGQAETETFYATPNATSVVDFPAFSSSVARLIHCEPYLPFLSPSRIAKFWTLPQWVYFYRLNGPGANPDVCWEVVDKYRITDTFVPMSLLVLFFLFGALMQPLMILEYMFGSEIIDYGLAASEVLPRYYKWRVGGHFFQLSGNKVRLQDLILPSFGWLAIELLLFVFVDVLATHLFATAFIGTTYILWWGNVSVCKKYAMRHVGDNTKDSESGELLQEEGGAAIDSESNELLKEEGGAAIESESGMDTSFPTETHSKQSMYEDIKLNEKDDGEDIPSQGLVDFLAACNTIMPSEKRLEKAFTGAKQRGEAALITYITAGYPTSQDTPYILLAMQEAGADVIELGVPYADPIADGPTLQNSHRVSIENGTEGVSAALDLLSVARTKGLTVPVILMGYYDGFEQHPGGIDAMCSEAKSHKADGFLAVGVPEGQDEVDFNTSCFRNGLSSILLVLPDTSEERIEHLVTMSSSFIYVVSSKGPTGATDALPPDLNDIVGRVRANTNIPLAVGFGISKPEMVHAVGSISDGAIVGSSITDCLNDAITNTIVERANIVRDYVAHLKVGAKQSVDICPTNQATTFCKIPSRLVAEIELERQNGPEIYKAKESRRLSVCSFSRSSMLKSSLRRSTITHIRFS